MIQHAMRSRRDEAAVRQTRRRRYRFSASDVMTWRHQAHVAAVSKV